MMAAIIAYFGHATACSDSTCFADGDTPLTTAPAGFMRVFTRHQWRGEVNLAKVTDAVILTSLAICHGFRNADRASGTRNRTRRLAQAAL